jgi:redox-sensitive bicupin YhaK (pirin superfamily)
MTISNASPDRAVEQVILPALRDLADEFKVRRALPSAQRLMVGPFILLDHFGPLAFRAGAGLDMLPHPHIGAATLTYLLQGQLFHRDSLGTAWAVRAGDVNWMTAGSGIVHLERSPKMHAGCNSLFGQQVWVALPRALEEQTPSFSHHAECDLPGLESDGASLTVLAGEAFEQRSPVPVHSDLMYVDVVLKPDARLAVPIEHLERAAFVLSGEIEAGGQSFAEGQLVVFSPGAQIVLQTKRGAHVMLLGGEPFPEPRHVYWNFVSSSRERIRQAADDWRNGRFPRIAGETDFIVLPNEIPHDVCDQRAAQRKAAKSLAPVDQRAD